MKNALTVFSGKVVRGVHLCKKKKIVMKNALTLFSGKVVREYPLPPKA